jgi:2-polyprenyl-3-methyl-5-hydroxy-6-metoxy-1,4-benzoquinol methylase
METTLSDHRGSLRIKRLPDGRHALHAEPTGIRVPRTDIVTDYPLELIEEIFAQKGTGFTIDEIGRDATDNDAQLDVRYSVLSYLPDELLLQPLRILDYGCGAGSSTLALGRLFPHAHIVAVDFIENSLRLARLRQQHYRLDNAEFLQVPSSGHWRQRSGFDLVFLNAVYEHLLPAERPAVLATMWTMLQPGGTLLLNQTPHRWFPIETHTSGLPLLNYLPAPLARWAQIKLSWRSFGTETWEQMLRRGIRGATVSEILGNIRRVDRGATLLKPFRIAGSWAGIWYAAKQCRPPSGRLARVIALTGRFADATGLPLSPYISIAVRKPA